MVPILRPLRISTSPDVTLHGIECGQPNGTAILLLHGYTDSWRSYEPLLAGLPASLRAIALSQRGHGDSTKPESTYGVADLADDARKAMDALGLTRAAIVGHSMGSLVAMRLAIDCPDRVSALVLIGAFATVRANAVASELWRDGVAALADPVEPEFVRAFQESTVARALPPPLMDTVVAESRKVPARVWRSALRAMLDDDFSDEIASIAAPTLIVWGDRDTICSRAEQERLQRALPQAELSVHEGVGHAPHWEDPARVAAELAAFLDRTLRQAV